MEKELLKQLKENLKNYLDDYQDKVRNSDRLQLEDLSNMQKEVEEIRNILIENWSKLDRQIKLLLIKQEI